MISSWNAIPTECTGAAIWQFPPFIKKLSSAVLNAHNCLKPMKKPHRAKGCLTTHCKVVSYLLSAYLMDSIVVEPNTEMDTSRQAANINPVVCSQSLWLNALECDSVYNASML